MQNMNNELEELQAAIKAYEQLAPHNKSIQEIQKIFNALKHYPQYVAMVAPMNQVPNLQKAFEIYQQAYPALQQLQRIYPKLYAQAAAQSPETPPPSIEELNDMIADMPEPEAWYKSIDRKKLCCVLSFLQTTLSSLAEMASDESNKDLLIFLSVSISAVLVILNLNGGGNRAQTPVQRASCDPAYPQSFPHEALNKQTRQP